MNESQAREYVPDPHRPLVAAVLRADSRNHRYHRISRYNRFLNVCYELQELSGGKPFPLAQQSIANALGWDQRWVSLLVSRARNDGYLTKVREHCEMKREAATYIFSDMTNVAPGVHKES